MSAFLRILFLTEVHNLLHKCEELSWEVTVSLTSGCHLQSIYCHVVWTNEELGWFLHGYCPEQQMLWAKFIPWAESAQNSLRHFSTGLTRFNRVSVPIISIECPSSWSLNGEWLVKVTSRPKDLPFYCLWSYRILSELLFNWYNLMQSHITMSLASYLTSVTVDFFKIFGYILVIKKWYKCMLSLCLWQIS